MQAARLHRRPPPHDSRQQQRRGPPGRPRRWRRRRHGVRLRRRGEDAWVVSVEKQVSAVVVKHNGNWMVGKSVAICVVQTWSITVIMVTLNSGYLDSFLNKKRISFLFKISDRVTPDYSDTFLPSHPNPFMVSEQA